MGLYLDIALVSLEGNLRRMLLCMKILVTIYDMYMMNLHFVDTICGLVSLMNVGWSIWLKKDDMYS